MNEYIVISNLREAGFVPGANYNALGKNWPKEYDCRFIEPGLINYDDMGAGTALVRKEALDNMAISFKGRPVLFKKHDDVTPDTFEEKACGMVNDVYYNATDGWYHAKFFVWDDETKRGIESKKYSVSCAYIPSETDLSGGVYNNLTYDMEVKDGEYTHLAIVENPRYNGAKIFVNSLKGGKTMKEKVNKVLAELKNTLDELFGKDSVKDPQNSRGISGPEVAERLDKIISLLNDLKNEEDEDKKKKADEEKKQQVEEEEKKKKDDEKKNQEDADKKKEEDEKKNQEDEKKKEDEEKQNELRRKKEAEGSGHFDVLNNASRNREEDDPGIITRQDRRAQGKKKYGSDA